MENHQNGQQKSRDIIYKNGRKKGKIVLGGQSDKLAEELTRQLQDNFVSRVLFHQAKAPNAKAVVVLNALLPIVIFALTVSLLIVLIRV